MGDMKLSALGPRGSGRGMCALWLELNVSVTGWQRKSASPGIRICTVIQSQIAIYTTRTPQRSAAVRHVC